MFNKNTKKGAFLSSLVALILCCSMFVGTTFAWFTDTVESGWNTIAAGNLDVELYHSDKDDKHEKVTSELKLFDDVTLWEPGAVVYEHFEVANVGSLALKYQMSLNVGKENNLNGHKLSEVLKVAIVDADAPNVDWENRASVLEAAKTAVNEDQGNGELSNFYLTGELEAGTSSAEKIVVIFWEPSDNDNLYNANNGQKTSDGEPLFIEVGVNLVATQMMSEEDSFDKNYDEFASILPKATVNNLGAQTISATTSFPNGDDVESYDMPFVLQFLPNETNEEAQSNSYRYWHADYVIKADENVPADSMALGGYYAAFCDDYNNGNWVMLVNEGTAIAAGTEIRLVELLGATVNYQEICQFGSDGIGFQCGAIDLTGENVGTTITVELRLYETTVDSATGTGNKNIETGNYEVVGTYSYTFGAVEVSNAEELMSAVEGGVSEVKLVDDIVYENTDPEEQLILVAADSLEVDGNGKTITNTTADPAAGNHGYVGFVPAAGEDATVSNLTVTGVGFVEVGHYRLGGGDYTINNLTVKNLVSTLASVDKGFTLACGFCHYGNAVLTDCVMTGTTAMVDGAMPVDLGCVNDTITVINGGEYGYIYCWNHATVTINDAKIGTLQVSPVKGTVTINAGTQIDKIVIDYGTGSATAARLAKLVISEDATVGEIVFDGSSYTLAEWNAYLETLS